jgi:DNA mismatch endonuclease (patch repair protein)
MRAVRPKDTDPELKIRRLLFARGFRYRLHVSSMPGSPDLVLPKHRVVVFVHGCFWHGHGCHLFKVPATRTDFWLKKIQGNRERDRRHETKLLADGWRILTIWECALKGKHKMPLREMVDKIENWIVTQDRTVPQLIIRHV